MRLPPGITGVGPGSGVVPDTDYHAFCEDCHAAARLLSGTVARMEPPWGQHTNNFATVVLQLPEGPVAALLNAHYPIVGFAEPPPMGAVAVRFTEAVRLTEVFRSIGRYTVLERQDLERLITEEDASDLDLDERKQLAYWGPARVGDAIFNAWD